MIDLPSEIVVDPQGLGIDMWALALMRKREGIDLQPDLAVRPRSTEETALCMRWAAERSLAVVPRGGGSGVCGGAESFQGAIVVDMTAMDEVLDVDARSMTVTSQAGVLGPALEQELTKHGMTMGHVPQSMPLSTVGGWIATKAAGQLSTLYGGIEDRVLGLTAVLADGTVVSSRTSPRASAGPDWWRLLIGSEGTLGIVTEATLECFRLPEHHSWVCCAPRDFISGIDLMRTIMQAGLRPAVARLYDRADSSVSFGGIGLDKPAVMILRFEGARPIVESQAALARDLLDAGGAESLDGSPGIHWWDRRFDAIGTYRKILGPDGPLGRWGVVDTMEVAATWERLPQVYHETSAAFGPHTDAVLGHVSHLYPSGANIYFTFLISGADSADAAEARYSAAWNDAIVATHGAGATMSHHHGVGLLKARWMPEELGSGMEVLRRVKQALDPDGRMNPGKLGL